MKKLSKKESLLVGITLFSMFFGAGNLIFPPFLAAQSGANAIVAFLGFIFSAIGLPVLGVMAVTKSGGLVHLASRVHPYFASVYIILLYLAIGPFLAIPRTASTSFEMAVLPFYASESIIPGVVYSFVFFCVAFIIAQNPEKLTEYLGKKMTPCLLILIFVIFAGVLVTGFGKITAAAPAYENVPAVKGFLEGYQTMDTLAALNFGMIISMNIKAKGVTEEKQVVKSTVTAGWIAGLFLLAVYGMLAFVGSRTGIEGQAAANGAQVLTHVVVSLFGTVGLVILAIIFVIACLNTCIGLFSCCGEYFHETFPKISYRNWVLLFAVISFLISNIGLTEILNISVPILNAIYPAAIMLILLACIHPWIHKFFLVYPFSISVCVVFSILEAAGQKLGSHSAVSLALGHLPFASYGFGWVVPTAIALILGIICSRLFGAVRTDL